MTYLFKWLGVVIFGSLVIESFFYSQRVGEEVLGEIINGAPIYKYSNFWGLHLLLLGIICLCYVIFKDKKLCMSKVLVIQGVFAIVTVGTTLFLLSGGIRTPNADQIQVYSAACLFNAGEFTNLTLGGYMEMYPHQLGFVAYMQGIFAFFNNTNFTLIQIGNAFFIGGIVFLLQLCVNKLTEETFFRITSGILAMLFVPLLLLGSWVYGDAPSFFFMFLFFYLLILYCEDAKMKYLLCAIGAIGCSVILRKNSLIVLIAASIVFLWCGWKYKKLRFCLATLGMVVSTLFCMKIVERTYETVSKYDIDGGIPSVMWIAMGMIEGESKPGWFNNFAVSNYYSVNCDKQAASQVAIDQIEERAMMFVAKPKDAISFYKRKISTQWNDPFYGTTELLEVDKDTNPTGMSYLLLNNKGIVSMWLASYQWLLYFGAFIYCIKIKPNAKPYQLVFLITVIGGFFFSILWEGNSRYMLPYALILIVVSISGLEFLLKEIVKLKSKKKS